MEECADLLDQKADQYGLSKKGEAFAATSEVQILAGDLVGYHADIKSIL